MGTSLMMDQLNGTSGFVVIVFIKDEIVIENAIRSVGMVL